MTDTLTPQAAPAGGLRANRNWHRLWLGQGISVVGDFVFDTTVLLWVGTVIAKGQTWAPAAVSGVLMAAALPVFLIGPVAGVFVDRWDRRRLMLAMDALRAALIAALLVIPATGARLPVGLRLALVYAVVALAAGASQFFNPARLAIIAAAIPKQDRTRAFSLSQATGSAAGIVGPALAAPLLFGVGVQWALILNALSFLCSFLLVRSLRTEAVECPADRPWSTFLADFREGISFFVRNRVLTALLGSVCVYTLGVGALNVLDVFFVTDNLHSAASWLGTLGAAFAVGTLVGALLAGALARRLSDTRMYWLCLVSTGVVILGYSRLTNLPAAVAVIAVLGLPVGAVNVVIGPMLLAVTPQRLLGRVVTVIGPVQQLASLITMALAGFLASTALRGLSVRVAGVHFGPIDSIFAVGALFMIAGGLWAAGRLRPPDPAEDPEAVPTAAA
ncbi:MFS transporter [Streptacidiphilus rugosus]|uniref:MFS transporter n=1 Tax=Streptacidiphilus rugosus TaxID=405783 RepID=UPI00068B6B8A|nr:MFS transporter [Streptacidiphilus rugosus]